MSSKYRSSATLISLNQAVGTVLAHDITEIRPGQFKGPAFKKGHIITEEDLPHLSRVGKEHLFVLHLEPGEIHEDDAAIKPCAALAGPGVVFDHNPSEGKISLKVAHPGLLKVNVNALTEVNLQEVYFLLNLFQALKPGSLSPEMKFIMESLKTSSLL